MEKITLRFENLPSTATPLTAENFNILIDKINEIVEEINKLKEANK